MRDENTDSRENLKNSHVLAATQEIHRTDP